MRHSITVLSWLNCHSKFPAGHGRMAVGFPIPIRSSPALSLEPAKYDNLYENPLTMESGRNTEKRSIRKVCLASKREWMEVPAITIWCPAGYVAASSMMSLPRKSEGIQAGSTADRPRSVPTLVINAPARGTLCWAPKTSCLVDQR